MRKLLHQIHGIIIGGALLILLVSLLFYDLYQENQSFSLFLLHILVIIGIFLGALGALFVLLFSKRDDMRLSVRGPHYGRPYLIRTDAEGRIESLNSTCLVNLKDIGKCKSVEEFDYNREHFDLVTEIRNQRPFSVRFQNQDNETVYLRFLPVKSGKKFYLVGENISQQQLNFEFHRNLSLYDPITKYPNRNYFGIKLQELFQNEKKLKKASSLALVDISGFKNIYKLFGNSVAEETLRALAALLEKSVWRYRAEVFHLGDDVFLVFFGESGRRAENWAEDFLEELKKPIAIAGNQFNIEVNIGILPIDIEKHPDLNPATAYECLGLALNRAKNSKKTNVVVFEESILPSPEHYPVADVREALEKEEFELNFQPQFNNITNEIVGFEALLRWNSPKYLFWSPAEFFEILAENEVLLEVGKFVLKETLAFAKET